MEKRVEIHSTPHTYIKWIMRNLSNRLVEVLSSPTPQLTLQPDLELSHSHTMTPFDAP